MQHGASASGIQLDVCAPFIGATKGDASLIPFALVDALPPNLRRRFFCWLDWLARPDDRGPAGDIFVLFRAMLSFLRVGSAFETQLTCYLRRSVPRDVATIIRAKHAFVQREASANALMRQSQNIFLLGYFFFSLHFSSSLNCILPTCAAAERTAPRSFTALCHPHRTTPPLRIHMG